MKNKFTLLQSLDEDKKKKTICLPKGITYQEYTIMVENKEMDIFIPFRESYEFEKELSKIHHLNKEDLRYVLRKYRGIKG